MCFFCLFFLPERKGKKTFVGSFFLLFFLDFLLLSLQTRGWHSAFAVLIFPLGKALQEALGLAIRE